jgi:predicted MFS family arabinose efflux permease
VDRVSDGFPRVGTIPWGVILVFLNDYLSQDKGLTVKQATFIVLLFGIGAAVGGLVGGVSGQRVYNRDTRLLPIFIGLCQIVAVFPMCYMINMDLGLSLVSSTVNLDEQPAGVSPQLMFKLYIVAILAGVCGLWRVAVRCTGTTRCYPLFG